MGLFSRVAQPLVLIGTLAGPAKSALANPGGSSSPINPIHYTSSEFKKAFDCYTATIQGNSTRQDEANFVLKALPYYDKDRDSQVAPDEIDAIKNPRARAMVLSFAENLENCGSTKKTDKPLLKSSAEAVKIKRPEDILEADRDYDWKALKIVGLIALITGLGLGLLIGRSTAPKLSLWRRIGLRLFPSKHKWFLKGPRARAEKIGKIADAKEKSALDRIERRRAAAEARAQRRAERAEKKAAERRERAERKAAEERKKAEEAEAKKREEEEEKPYRALSRS